MGFTVPFQSIDSFELNNKTYHYSRLTVLEEQGLVKIASLPYSIRVLLESVLRHCDGVEVTENDVKTLAAWSQTNKETSIPFKPSRVILQDFTGVPAVVDLAAMRDAMKKIGGNPKKINPLIPVDLIIDHSIQTDDFGHFGAMAHNVELEFERNRERYALLHWAQKAFDNFRIIPPSVGIIHQVNLEYLADVVTTKKCEKTARLFVFPDAVVGTDSHTVMINGLGVLGWGVGGIEAEAVMLGQSYTMLVPQVIGVQLSGKLSAVTTATDLVLTVTELLRKEGVVGKFVEYFGDGVANMPIADRAVLANMAPEYGATMGYFPVDEKTLEYLRETGRNEGQIQLVEKYLKLQSLFRENDMPIPNYTKILTLDLASVQPSLAGPKRPQDRVLLSDMQSTFRNSLTTPMAARGFGLAENQLAQTSEIAVSQPGACSACEPHSVNVTIGHGSVVIASITSCTNTSNPSLMIAAGLLAKKAVKKGLQSKSWVKTSIAPGSRVVTDYLRKAELEKPLETLGFYTAGYGCMTCIGNSGSLPQPVAEAITKNDLVAAAVLSGNRNFEGRVNPLVKANYLASPPLVVAYAIAGTVNIDLTTEPLGIGFDGKPVYLREIFPTDAEISAVTKLAVDPALYKARYADVGSVCPEWNAIPAQTSELFAWDANSTYIQNPPFLDRLTTQSAASQIASQTSAIQSARCLIALGDSVTTDHISPAGSIKPDSSAGHYLQECGVVPADFNSYGSRRGNDRVMTRGTFANIRIRNLLAPGTEGGVTRHFPDDQILPIFDAASRYHAENVPLIVLAGNEYGTGSSRDWAAKGTMLLGVRAVIAASFERIHRGNLVGMGVLPLQFQQDVTWQSLGLTGEETFDFEPIPVDVTPGSDMTVTATKPSGKKITFSVRVRIDTPIEVVYYINGGILPAVIRKLSK
ncbi:MAG: aconitate hydratase AcnA [Planctomycetaceae bacterium]|jgi:aconitate hydratase|nr:aconitate hydratase AcnA [Planctomycetaceae bacterium]